MRRFHLPHAHLESAFGSDWFGRKAEDFARFFGTPTFLDRPDGHRRDLDPGQRRRAGPSSTSIRSSCSTSRSRLQAAYAAPLILLAQTRQADRDKANSIADAQHREELHQVNEERQQQMQKQAALLVEMLEQNTSLTESVETLLRQNTELTETVSTLVERIEAMTAEMHSQVAHSGR